MIKGLSLSIAFAFLLAVSSCSDTCVVCSAVNVNKTIVKQDTLCADAYNKGKFIDRFEENFKAYNPKCVDQN